MLKGMLGVVIRGAEQCIWQAARARCTVGEISDALEVTWGRAVSETQTVKGAYLNEFGDSEEIVNAQKAIQV